jgi:GDP-L-fucose synthase|tara:strand:- start:10208 stop:11161 length:954 start_codon:yes stop_codon:yes gene_type:complete
VNKDSIIFIAGHLGMVGSAIQRKLEQRGFKNLITRTHKDLDLTKQAAVDDFFRSQNIDYVILAAAKVGGIFANNNFPAEFIYQNLMIEANVINSSYKARVKRLLFLGSSCIYPRDSEQPIREESLLSDILESTNEPYAIAKIAGIKLCESYNRQYDTDFRSVMPTNLYGVNDNFHPDNSHVIPGLMRRFHIAKINNESEVEVWGTGKVKREFMYVDDMAEASIFILETSKNIYINNTKPMLSHINIGTGKDMTILEMSEIMKDVIGYKGKIVFDASRPEGPKRKLMDVSRLSQMGWNHQTNLKEGLRKTYSWYLSNL